MDSSTPPEGTSAEIDTPPASSRPGWWLRVILPVLASGGFAATLVAGLFASDRNFWHIDDAVNEFTPYVSEIGRLISQGEWPTLSTRSFVGGNELLDFNRSPFHPLTWVAAALIHGGGAHRGVTVFAAVLIASAFLGGYVLGRTLVMRPGYSYLLGATLATGPIFLYVYASDWWNGAIGMVSFIWAAAALARAMRRPDGLSSLLLGLGVAAVFLVGWPHGYLALVLVGVVALGFGAFGPQPLAPPGGRARWLLRLLIPVVLGALIASPAYAEYFAASSSVARVSGIDNGQNFLVPSVGQLLAVMNPLGGDFWSTFGGYRYWDIPIGFVTVVGYLAIFFLRVGRKVLVGIPVLVSASAGLLLILASQTPSQLGPTRWPFRFLPFAGIALAVLILFLLDRGRLAFSRRRLMAATLTLVGLTFSSASRFEFPSQNPIRAVLLPLLLICLVVASFLWLARRRRMFEVAVGLTVVGIMVMLVGAPSAGFKARYLQAANLPGKSSLATVGQAAGQGMILVTGVGAGFSTATNTASRALTGGIAAFNGYDPVSQRHYDSIFHPFTAHGLVDERILDYLTSARPEWGDCGLVAAGITAVATASDPVVGRHAALARCGFSKVGDNHKGAALFSRPSPVQAGGPTIGIGGVTFGSATVRDQTVQVEVRGSSTPGQLIFARMAWLGYSAELDGEPLTVSPIDGYLVAVDIPAQASGVLTLSYRPITWPTVPIVAGLALLGLVLFAVAQARLHRRLDAPSEGLLPGLR